MNERIFFKCDNVNIKELILCILKEKIAKSNNQSDKVESLGHASFSVD